MDLYVIVLRLLLVEELYPATAASLNYDIIAGEKGITVKVNKFNEKLPVSVFSVKKFQLTPVNDSLTLLLALQLLARTIAEYIRNYPNLVKVDLFELAKEQQLKKYYNHFIKPQNLARYQLFIVIIKNVYI